MRPEVWGPNLWGAFHTLCLTGTITPEFIEEFAAAIPCPACASHFKQLLIDFPFEEDPDKFRWSVLIHNQVNERIGKPIFKVEEARAKWSARPCSQMYFKIVAMAIIILILLFIMYFRK